MTFFYLCTGFILQHCKLPLALSMEETELIFFIMAHPVRLIQTHTVNLCFVKTRNNLIYENLFKHKHLILYAPLVFHLSSLQVSDIYD